MNLVSGICATIRDSKAALAHPIFVIQLPSPLLSPFKLRSLIME